MSSDHSISTRKLAALLREHADGVDRQTLLNQTIHAMRALRAGRSAPMLDDPRLRTLLAEDDALARVSQALSLDGLEQAYRATAQLKRKFRVDEIPLVTQLFTPRWVVEFLLKNSLGKLWREVRGRQSVTTLRILDPACGTMNFGLVAIEMLRGMYLEEFGRDVPVEQIIANNLFGIDIDPVMIESAQALLAMNGAKSCNLHCGDALFDPMPRHFPESFDIIATNPPYLSARNLSRIVVEKMKRRYPRAWRDQYACFIERAIELLAPGGRAAMLTMQSFMFTAGFESLRHHIHTSCAIEKIAHFGGGVFDVGNQGTLQTVGMVLRRESDSAARDNQIVDARRLVDCSDKSKGLRNRKRRTQVLQSDIASSPRGAWCYWLTGRQREMFVSLPKLGDVAPPRQGLATTDNARFVRFWWEVEPTSIDAPCRATPETWFPYVKSGRFRRWYEAPQHRVNWRDDGAEIKQAIVDRYPYLKGQWQWVAKNTQHYFKRGVTYSYLTSGRFSARLLEEGAIFYVAGSSLFPDDPLTMLAILNSSVARDLLLAINPTVNFQVGDLAQLPLPNAYIDVKRDVQRAIELTRSLDRFDETSPDFVAPMPAHDGENIWNDTHHALSTIERKIDDAVSEMYGCTPASSVQREPPRFDPADQKFRHLSYELRQRLAKAGGPLRIDVQQYQDFYAWYVRLYRRRPPVWMFHRDDEGFFIAHDFATRDAMPWIARRLCASLPRGWERRVDEGIAKQYPALKGRLGECAVAATSVLR